MEAAQHPWPALGVLLLRDGLVTRDDLNAILGGQRDSRQQRITGGRLGEILVEQGVVSATQVARLLAEQYELPFVELAPAEIDARTARAFSIDQAYRFSALPINRRLDGSYDVAIADPSTVVFSDELRGILGSVIHFVVVGNDAMEAAITEAFSRSDVLVETAEGAGEVVALRDDEPIEDGFPRDGTLAQLWPPLGALLVREGLVTDGELEAALAEQRLSTSQRLGEILVERGSVSPTIVARLVAEQYELPFAELDADDVDSEVACLLSQDTARRLRAVPINRHDDGSLELAIADPTIVFYSDDLQNELDTRLEFVVSPPDAIDALIARVYGARESEDDLAPRVRSDSGEPLQSLTGDDEQGGDSPFAYTAVDASVFAVALRDAADEPATDDGNPVNAAQPEEPMYTDELEDPVLTDDLDEPVFMEQPEEEGPVFTEQSEESELPPLTSATGETDNPSDVDDAEGGADERVEVDLVAQPGLSTNGQPELVAPLLAADVDDGHAQADDLQHAIGSGLEKGASVLHMLHRDGTVDVDARIGGALEMLGSYPADDLPHVLGTLTESPDLEIHALPTSRGTKITVSVRERPVAPTTLAELGLAGGAEAALRTALARTGLVVVTGSPGSGVTTTLYAALAELATNGQIAATVEDRIARLVDGVDQTEIDERSGYTYATGLRQHWEMDADVVLVSAIPDAETAATALQCALAGRHVLAGMSESDGVSALTRLFDLAGDRDRLAPALACIVSQRMARRVCDECRETYYASSAELELLGLAASEGHRLLARGRGCRTCSGTGSRGQVAVFEVVTVTDVLLTLVRDGASSAEIRDAAATTPEIETLRDELTRLCLDGLTTTAELERLSEGLTV